MNAEDRRKNILTYLENASEPVKGVRLAKKYGVSRQVIVQDIAILRAEGYGLTASLKGYEVEKKEKRLLKIINSAHTGMEEMIEELEIIVDNGGKVIDVIVEHPIYGEIKVNLMISNRKDIKRFSEQIKKNSAEALSSLTGGEHLHTIEVENEEMYEEILRELEDRELLKG